MSAMTEEKNMRSRISPGFQISVPSELRRKFGVDVGDEVVWILKDDEVRTDFRKRPGLENIVGLGSSGKKGENAVEWKKKAQRGEL